MIHIYACKTYIVIINYILIIIILPIIIHNQTTKDNGKAVASSVADPTSNNPSSGSNDITTTRFQALDVDGRIEATCDAKGYVFTPGRAASIGKVFVRVFFFVILVYKE